VSAILQINEKGIFSLLKINRETRERERERERERGNKEREVFVIITRGERIRKVDSSEGYQ